MAGVDENCLVCFAKGVPLRSPILNAANGECQQDGCLNHEVQVMLLLRKVLGIRKGFLELVLQRSEGRDPSSWDLKLCHVCLRIFEEVMFVWERLSTLQGEFNEMSKRLRLKMLRVVEGEEFKSMAGEQQLNESGTVNVATKRKAGRPPRKKPKPMLHIPEHDNSSISMKIRSEFDRLHSNQHQAQERSKMDLDHPLQRNMEPSTMPKLKRESSRIMIDQFQTTAVADDAEVEDVPEETVSNSEDLADDIQEESYSNDDMGVPSSTERNEFPEESNEYQEINDDGLDLPDPESDPPSCQENDDSDFEPSRLRKRSKRASMSRKRKAIINIEDREAVIRAIKMESPGSYQCSECSQTFSTSLQCDEHILHEHYDGTWPKIKICPLCGTSFKGETWLRQHLKMRHPDYKLPTDEILQRCIKEGTVPEITYDLVPVEGGGNQTASFSQDSQSDVGKEKTSPHQSEKQNEMIFTEDEPPPDQFNVPYVQTKNGKLCYILPTNSFCSAMPEHVLAQLTKGPVLKKCDRCDKAFPTELQLKAHVKRSHEGEGFCWDCPICPKMFKRIRELFFHLQKTHVNGEFVCKKCGNMFREEILLRAHIQRVHLGIINPFVCVKCGLKYPKRNYLNKHMQTVHNLQIVVPDKMLKSIALRASRNHPKPKQSKRSKINPCQICSENDVDINFETQRELYAHMKRKHKDIPATRPYPCPICGNRFSTPSLVDKHLQAHTVRSDVEIDTEPSPQEEEFVCYPCNKTFPKKSLLEAHLAGRNHDYVRPYVCELCSEGFRTLLNLENHQSLRHHEQLQIQPFKCKFCDKILGSERTLKGHTRRIHTKDAKFKCPQCDLYFEYEMVMKKHITLKHSNTRDFLCPYCPKAFACEVYLTNHLRIHTGEKPWECKTCSKKFADERTYSRHVEAHSGILHDCSHCGKTGFKTRHALRVHMKKFHPSILERLDRESKQPRIAITTPTTSTNAALIPDTNFNIGGAEVNESELE